MVVVVGLWGGGGGGGLGLRQSSGEAKSIADASNFQFIGMVS